MLTCVQPYRKIPWRLSKFQKARQRRRLRAVDNVVETLHKALAKKGQTLESLERWKAEMPTEQEMLPKDKYTIFDRKEKRYRKGIHSMSNPILSSSGSWCLVSSFASGDQTWRDSGRSVFALLLTTHWPPLALRISDIC